MAGRNRETADSYNNVKLSKALSWLLRHGAEKEGFSLMAGGFLFVDDILQHQKYKQHSIFDIQRVVELNDKQRFALKTDEETGKLKIRANQGQTFQVEDLDLTPITDPQTFPAVVHGTYKRPFMLISKQGLKRMARNHIHFAAGEPGEDGIISGMRKSCSVVIFINLRKALEDGYQFFQSANGVILCPGNEDGILPTTYFDKVLDRASRTLMPFTNGTLDQESASGFTTQMANEKELGTSDMAVSADALADEFEDKKRKGKKKHVIS